MDHDFPANLWIAAHDIDERNAQLAVNAWEENGLEVPETFLSQLVPFLCKAFLFLCGRSGWSFADSLLATVAHPASAIRLATARAIAEGIDFHPSLIADAISLIIVEYHEKVGLFFCFFFAFAL